MCNNNKVSLAPDKGQLSIQHCCSKTLWCTSRQGLLHWENKEITACMRNTGDWVTASTNADTCACTWAAHMPRAYASVLTPHHYSKVHWSGPLDAQHKQEHTLQANPACAALKQHYCTTAQVSLYNSHSHYHSCRIHSHVTAQMVLPMYVCMYAHCATHKSTVQRSHKSHRLVTLPST